MNAGSNKISNAQQAQERENERSNEHIASYLRHFINTKDAPEHALMIAGPWGIGKTRFVENLINEYRKQDTQSHFIYVSLAGLETIRDMDIAVSIALHPQLDHPFAKTIFTGVTLVARFFRVDPQIRMHAFVNKFKAKLYIFDDLERCQADIQTSLGYINRFVEHARQRVVIVAHEEPITKSHEKYSTIKEKIVGQTFTFQPVIHGPLDYFIGISGTVDAQGVLRKYRHQILNRYSQSNLNNLRILRQTIWDLARFVDALSADHRANDELMTSLVDTFAPLSFALKAAQIEPHEVAQTGTYSSYSFSQRDNEETNWKKFRRTYPDNGADSLVLPGDIWSDVLVQGFLDTSRINSACAASRYVAGRQEQPSWRRLWAMFDETDDEVPRLIADVEERYANREFEYTGVALHILGIRLGLASDNLIPFSRSEVLADFKSYIDHMYANGSILSDADEHEMLRRDGYGGLGYQENTTAEFQEAYDYYRSQRERYEQDRLPHQALELLDVLQASPRTFIEKICYTNGGTYEYADIPILLHTPVDRFAEALVELRPTDRRAVFSSLKLRYEHGRISGALAAERDWIEKLRNQLTELASARSGFARVRIEKHILWSIDPILQKTETDDDSEQDGE